MDDRRRNTERGFTLIELILVVLILGILMAIAIPVFLGLTSSARSSGAEANVTIAAQDEASFFAQHGAYGTTTSSPTMSQADGGLNWSACTVGSTCPPQSGSGKNVWVGATTDGGYAAVVVGETSTNGSNYWELVSQNPQTPSPEYVVTSLSTAPAPRAFASSTWRQAGG